MWQLQLETVAVVFFYCLLWLEDNHAVYHKAKRVAIKIAKKLSFAKVCVHCDDTK